MAPRAPPGERERRDWYSGRGPSTARSFGGAGEAPGRFLKRVLST